MKNEIAGEFQRASAATDSSCRFGRSLTLREALPDEWVKVADITENAYQEYADAMDPDFWHDYVRSTRNLILRDSSVSRIVALNENHEIVGSVIYCEPYEKVMRGKLVQNPYPEMRLLAVDSTRRNSGVAKALIEYCEERARRQGAPAMSLHTTKYMTTARAMYERRGYSRFEQIDFDGAPNMVVWGFIKSLRSDAV